MNSLSDRTYIHSNIIHYAAKRFVQPPLSNSDPVKAHVFNCHLMYGLLGGSYHLDYDFKRDTPHHTNIVGGFDTMDELYFVIHKRDAMHWIFVRANVIDKQIEVYDSLGPHDCNMRFASVVCQYIYDAMADLGYALPSFEDWKTRWNITDESVNSPRQRDAYNCGLFVLSSMFYLRHNRTLSSRSYDPNVFAMLDSRAQLAWLVWKDGDLSERRWQLFAPDYRPAPNWGISPNDTEVEYVPPRPPTLSGTASPCLLPSASSENDVIMNAVETPTCISQGAQPSPLSTLKRTRLFDPAMSASTDRKRHPGGSDRSSLTDAMPNPPQVLSLPSPEPSLASIPDSTPRRDEPDSVLDSSKNHQQERSAISPAGANVPVTCRSD